MTRGSSSTAEYSLAFGDGTLNPLYDGKINLLKNGQVVQVLNVLPDPTNFSTLLMAVDPNGRLSYETAGSHAASHGITNQGTADGLIASLGFLPDLRLIRAITTTGVVVPCDRRLDERYHTRPETTALLAPLQALTAVLSFQLPSIQASIPKVRLRPGQSIIPSRIQSSDSGSLDKAYDSSLQHVHVWANDSTPIDSPT